MRAASYLRWPTWVILLSFLGLVAHADPTASIAYPSNSPSANYLDYVQVVWVSSWEITRVFVVCRPNNGQGYVAVQSLSRLPFFSHRVALL